MRSLAIIMAMVVLPVLVPEVWASSSQWRFSQARMRQAHDKWQKRQAEFWKKFDAEMAGISNGGDGKPSNSNPDGSSPTRRRK